MPFEGASVSPTAACAFILSHIKSFKIFKLGYSYNSTFEIRVLNKLYVRQNFLRSPKIFLVYWIPPPSGWVKVNIDSSAKGALGPIACGGIFKNARGFVCDCFSVFLGNGFAFEAKLWAVINAISITFENGWHKLWLEIDFSLIICLLSSKF